MRSLNLWTASAAGLSAALLAAAPASAQDTDAQVWTNNAVNVSLSDDVTLGAHAVVRFGDDAGGLSEIQLGSDLELDAGGGVGVGAGYSYVTTYSSGDLRRREHRLRQQVSVRLGSIAGGDVSGRLRLEQRWRDDGDDMLLRLRPRLTWTRPIGPDKLALRLMHESFLHLNSTDWGGESRYARMRNQVSLRRSLGKSVTGELGYLNQYNFSASGRDQMVHALTAALTFGF